MNRARIVILVLVPTLLLLACAGATPDSGGASDGATSPGRTPAAEASGETDPEGTSPPEDPGPDGPGRDGSDIDWATVDLTTIDWPNLDLRTVDWIAVRDNPTAADLSPETSREIQGRLDPGDATLSIGDMTWEFPNFLCASGHENTESDRFSFTTNAIHQFDGVRTQMQYTVEDATGSGRLEGDGVVHRIDFDDIGDFENPALKWSMTAAQSVSIDGYEIAVAGTFDDGLTEGTREDIPGTLEAECATTSRF